MTLRRIGILAGTFDPVHLGHTEFAREAVKQTGLTKVYFLPERRPRYKRGVTAFEYRLEMLKRAAEPHAELGVLELNDENFTVAKTLPELQGFVDGAQLRLLIGSDLVSNLHRWSHIEKLLSVTPLIIGLRFGDEELNIRRILDKFDFSIKAVFIKSPMAQASASKIRLELPQKQLDPAVLEYIQSHRLYLP